MLDAFVRWIHVGAGVVWMGQLFFFNLVHAAAVKDLDGPTLRAVIPAVMPRALYFFRWAALFTWLSGLLLIGLVYHSGGLMVGADASSQDRALAFAGSQALIFFGFFVYDLLWKWVKPVPLAAVLSLALFTGAAFALSRVMAGRALWLHLGAILGSVMMLNVWMRIWPAQKKLIRGLKELDPAPGPEVAALAAQRSRHNLYLGFPVLLFMVAPHTFAVAYGDDLNWAWAAVALVVGAAVARLLLYKAHSPAPQRAP